MPGVLFCNRQIATPDPRLMDLGATVLDMFGVDVPKVMDGRPLAVADCDGVFPQDGRSAVVAPADIGKEQTPVEATG